MTNTIKLLDVVALTVDLPEYNLWRGQVGTVVEILAGGTAFEVEFSDREGRTYESLGLRPDQIMVLHKESNDMVRIDIDTTDPDFLKDLDAARIEGLTYTFRMEASAPVDINWLSITIALAVTTGGHFFAEWLKERLIRRTPYQTRVNNIDVSQNVGQVTVIINNVIQQHDGDVAKD